MRLLVAATAALLLPLTLATPASGENRVFAGVRGDAERPANDIVAYSVNYTADQVAIVLTFAAPNTDELDMLHEIDVNGDGTADYSVYGTGSVDRNGSNGGQVCENARVNRTGTAAGISFPASCIGSPGSLRVQVYASTGSVGYDIEPADGTWSPAVARGGVSTPPPPSGPREVTIGIRQASGVYTFSGAVSPAEGGRQVTVARLDSLTKRVTGVASTTTDAAGRYTIRTRLPAGFAGFYTLTASHGRSRLYGLVVPTR